MKPGRKLITKHDDAIREWRSEGQSIRSIADRLGLSQVTVSRICKRIAAPRVVHDAQEQLERDVKRLAAEGKFCAAIAAELGVGRWVVATAADRAGVTLANGQGSHNKGQYDEQRADAFARLYMSGQTLQQIGDQFGLTRERVRQVLRKRTDVVASDGGAAVVRERIREDRASKRDQKTMARLGCDWEEYKKILQLGREMQGKGVSRERTPMGAFISQRGNAHRRGIGWELNFWQWWKIWEQSGRWHQRGRGRGYVMCRRGDVGPYALGNVFIATAIENVSTGNRRKTDLPTGVSQRGKRFYAQTRINGEHINLGTFASAALAHSAYLAAQPATNGGRPA